MDLNVKDGSDGRGGALWNKLNSLGEMEFNGTDGNSSEKLILSERGRI